MTDHAELWCQWCCEKRTGCDQGGDCGPFVTAERLIKHLHDCAEDEAADALSRPAVTEEMSELADMTTAAAETNRANRELADALETEKAKFMRIREALDEIANPIGAMRRRAEAEGGRLNGPMAVTLASDASYLSGLAARALTGGDHG